MKSEWLKLLENELKPLIVEESKYPEIAELINFFSDIIKNAKKVYFIANKQKVGKIKVYNKYCNYHKLIGDIVLLNEIGLILLKKLEYGEQKEFRTYYILWENIAHIEFTFN